MKVTRDRVAPCALLASVALLLPVLAAAQQAPPSKDAMKMGSPAALPQGATVESMWPAPTAADWAKPTLIPWQRSFEDALALARKTGAPMLVCVNMDGEPASEHFAGIRYRQPEIAALLEPYVCLPASVYRHTPRDYDGQGRRVPCPRFGTVTCGEHIAIESELYGKYFEGTRVAPRHILLEPDGQKGYDIYYSWDTESVFHAYRVGAEGRPPRIQGDRGDVPIAERTTSTDVVDRTLLEQAYVRGDRVERRALLEATLVHPEVDQIDLLRLALFGLDVDLARLARRALARTRSEAAVDLIAEALKLPMAAEERQELVDAAARLAETYPRARTLVAVQQGLVAPSRWIDAGQSLDLAAEYRASAAGAPERIEGLARAAEAHPEDAEAQLRLAESLLARARAPETERRFAGLLQEDARHAALEAERQGARGWRLDAVLAVVASLRGETEQAVARALAAVEGGMPRPGTDAGELEESTRVTVLALFAQARQQAIAKAYRERAPWPPEWLADIHAAYTVLAQHPLGTDVNVADGYDFLNWLGATGRAGEVLEKGLARFPESWALHQRLRARTLWEGGPEALEAAYDRRLREEPSPGLQWFAAFASLVAAEGHRRAGESARALASYERALDYYSQDLASHPDHAESIDHYAAMALAGRAKIELEQGELARATDDILAAFARSPEAAAVFDGLGVAGIDTARMLLARLEEERDDALAERVQSGLDVLGPRLLDLPDLQRGVPNEAARAGDRRGRRGG